MKYPRFFLAAVLAAASMLLAGCFTIQPVTSSNQQPAPVKNEKIVNFHVIGKGIAPETAINKGQAMLMAEKAAVADGYRKLIEEIRGVYVDAYTKAGKGFVDYDIIQTHTQSWLRGAEVIDIKMADHGITEAHMRLRVNFAQREMVWWPVGLGTSEGMGSSTVSGTSSSYNAVHSSYEGN